MELFIILVLTTIALSISIMSIMGIIKSKELDAKILYSFLILLLLISYTHKPKAIDVYIGEQFSFKEPLKVMLL